MEKTDIEKMREAIISLQSSDKIEYSKLAGVIERCMNRIQKQIDKGDNKLKDAFSSDKVIREFLT